VKFARVIGTTVSTVKDPHLVGLKLLLCVRCGADGIEIETTPFVAVDAVGAGAGEVVLVAEGSAARISSQTERVPTDATIVGIVDSIEAQGTVTYAESQARGRGRDAGATL